jgi:hypothetical protein
VTLLVDVVAAQGRALRELQRLTARWPVRARAEALALWRREAVRSAPSILAKVLDPATVQTPALDVIDQTLCDVAEGRTRRVIITMPPQEGKSTRVARVGPLWFLLRFPEWRIAVGSYAESLAMGHGRWIRDQITSFGLDAQARRGARDVLGLRIDPAAGAKGEWDLADHRGGVKSIGVGGGLTGFPVDLMIIDDPVKDRAQADSITYREAVWSWWTDVVLTRLAPGAPVILIMTRWHEDDLAGRLIGEADADPTSEPWTIVHIPAQCDDPATDVLGRSAGEYLASARRRTVAQWEATKAAVGARSWAALYQGRPAPLEGGIFQWAWIRPWRVGAAPQLQRVVVAVDTTGGGSDEAGIIAAGLAADRRTYVLGDRSGTFTAAQQWRAAWFAVLEYEADSLIYESNLVDPIMRKAIPASWRRIREQAWALQEAAHGVPDPADVDSVVVTAAARLAVGSGDDDVASADNPLDLLAAQLWQVVPYLREVLDAPVTGPARVEGVRATRGKAIRAEPVAQAYELGAVSHVGAFAALESELVTWQEGQASPNRLDALVWAWTRLNQHTLGQVSRASNRRRVGRAGLPGRTGPR